MHIQAMMSAKMLPRPRVCQACDNVEPDVVQLTVKLDAECNPSREIEAFVCTTCLETGAFFNLKRDVKTPEQQLAGKMRRRTATKPEKKTALELDGKRTLASGATRGDGDVVAGRVMVENKSTTAASFTLRDLVIDKARAQARKQRRSWVMRVKMKRNDVAVLDWNRALAFLEAESEARSDPE